MSGVPPDRVCLGTVLSLGFLPSSIDDIKSAPCWLLLTSSFSSVDNIFLLARIPLKFCSLSTPCFVTTFGTGKHDGTKDEHCLHAAASISSTIMSFMLYSCRLPFNPLCCLCRWSWRLVESGGGGWEKRETSNEQPFPFLFSFWRLPFYYARRKEHGALTCYAVVSSNKQDSNT